MPDGTVTIKINVDGKDVEVELGKVRSGIEDTGDTAEKVSENAQRNTAAVGVALAAVAASLAAASLKAYEFSAQFESAFAKTQTIMDTNVMKAEEMRQAVLDLSRDSAMAADDVSEAVYQAISGSVDTADAVNFVDKANRLAVAGFTSLTNATDVLTTTLNAYHLSAERVDGISNVLIRTQNLGKTSVDELSASMGKAIATGSAYGVDLQNISAAYVELTRNGINTAESTTYINSMLNELGDSGKTVGKILREQTGKSFGQLMQDGASLADVLQILLNSVDGNTEALMGLWGSQEAGKAANAIVSQSIEDFNQVLSQMNSEMAGTTGTTEQAYETMTSTSDFIDRRLNNSVKNLAIAYGDILAPPMDAIKSLGADILEGLTDLIHRSPTAAAAIAAISTGVIVFAVGLAAYTVAAKAAAIAQEALNKAMESNPFLLAAFAITALVVGLVSFVSALGDSNDQLDQFNEKLAEIDDSFNKELAAVEVTSERTNEYIDRLEELEEAGLKTTEQQQEYHQILEELVKTVPELADLIDLETDSIKGGTKALRDNTAAWVANAKEQAYQKHLADLTEAYTEALIEQKKIEIELQNNTDKRVQLGEKEEALLEERNRLLEEGAEKAAKFNEENGTTYTAEDFADASALARVNAELDDLRSAFAGSNTEADVLREKLDDAKEAVAAASEQVELANQAIEELADAEKDAGDAADDTGGKIDNLTASAEEICAAVPGITESLQAFADKYSELYEAAKSSLENQFKLWEQAEQVTAISVGQANKGIQSQIDYWHRYNDDLTVIKDSGIKGMEQLYQFISDGSTDSVAMAAGIADAIRSGNQPAVEEMIALYGDLAAAQGDTADAMLQMQTDMDKALDELLGSVDTAIGDMEMPDEAWNAAHETILAYARGLYDGTASVETAARAVANSASRVLLGRRTNGSSGTHTTLTYASGTDWASAGLALVGEEGPELVYLRGGERILNADETRSALRGLYNVPAPATESYSGSAAPAAVGGGPAGDRTITVVVPVEVDGRELARVTARAMGEELMFDGY